MDSSKRTNRLATVGMLLALGMVLSYLESLIPIPIGVPGVKLGIGNLVSVYALYKLGAKDAYFLGIVRVLLSGFLFSGLSTILYGIFGAILSITTMCILKKIDKFGVVGISVFGAIFHNIGQIIVASIVIKNAKVIYYFPILFITAIVTGTIIGLVGGMLIRRVNNTN